MNENNVPHAVHVLTTALKNDPGFYQSYQANIAMAMYDEMGKFYPITETHKPVRLKLCNAAAKRFLDMWIGAENQGPKQDWFQEAF